MSPRKFLRHRASHHVTQGRCQLGPRLAHQGIRQAAEHRREALAQPVVQHQVDLALDLARTRGAHFAEGGKSHAFWAPVSLRKRADGTTAVFPHFVMDRAKPGFVTVNQAGQRFVNESTSYHLFGLAMQASASVPAYLVCDAGALKKYGMGMVRPGGKGLEPFLADGYLTAGATLEELAKKLGVDAALGPPWTSTTIG